MTEYRMDSDDGKQSKSGFSCCRLKKHSYRICINCYAIYHKSCLERKLFVPVQDYLVECCEANKKLVSLEEHDDMKVQIEQLSLEVQHLTRHNQKLETRLRAAQDEAVSMEEELMSVISKQRAELRDQLGELSIMKTKLRSYECDTISKSKPRMHDCSSQTFLIAENSWTQTLAQLSEDASTQTCHSTLSDKSCQTSSTDVVNEILVRRSRLLVLADDNGRGLINKLISELPSSAVQMVHKPGAAFCRVTEGIKDKLRTYDKYDFVVILAGTIDLEMGVSAAEFGRYVSNVFDCTRHVNVIIATIPPVGSCIEKKRLDEFNEIIWKLAQCHSHVRVLPFFSRFNQQDFTTDGRYLHYQGKVKLAKYIAASCHPEEHQIFEKITTRISKRAEGNIASRRSFSCRGRVTDDCNGRLRILPKDATCLRDRKSNNAGHFLWKPMKSLLHMMPSPRFAVSCLTSAFSASTSVP